MSADGIVEDKLQAITSGAPTSISFDEVFKQLVIFRKKNNGSLHITLSHPIFSRITNALSSQNMERLMGSMWDDRFAELKAYKAKHGNCDLPATHSLAEWVKCQRHYYELYEEGKPNPLTKSRYELLKDVELICASNLWNQRLEELKQYREDHGHCDPPIDFPRLGIWVLNQRFNLSEMPKERIEALDSLGFTWNQIRVRRKDPDRAWNAKYGQLLEFVKEHNHTNVPSSHGPLWNWVTKQNYEYNKLLTTKVSSLSRYRIDKLNEIGFKWKIHKKKYSQTPWEERYEELKKFKEQNGHCNIPRKHKYFKDWPDYQRQQYRLFKQGEKAKIDQEKIDKLIAVGFFDPAEIPETVQSDIFLQIPSQELMYLQPK